MDTWHMGYRQEFLSVWFTAIYLALKKVPCIASMKKKASGINGAQ
jgi:hypothetical protein